MTSTLRHRASRSNGGNPSTQQRSSEQKSYEYSQRTNRDGSQTVSAVVEQTVVATRTSTAPAGADSNAETSAASTRQQPAEERSGVVEYSIIDDSIDTSKTLLPALTDVFTATSVTASASTMTKAMTGKQVAKDESRLKKILLRIASGAGMIAVFVGCVAMGHMYVCLMVALTQVALFRELVKVRYHAHYATVSGGTIPLFRTLQWMWFSVAIVYTYGDFITEIIQHNPELHNYVRFAHYATILSFALYSGTFVLTIATMQVGYIKFQLNQLCWTIVVLCLTVGQLKYIMHNIFNGLFWFALPIMLVVTNDIMAYVAGVTCGRKFIQRPFITFSPNKTWEGFIGGGIFTIITGWYLSRFLAQYPWMACPNNKFSLVPHALNCDLHHVFQPSQSILPQQIFELFPPSLVKMIPGIVEYCSVRPSAGAVISLSDAEHLASRITPCISGEPSHTFHHFELVLKNVYPVQIHALWLALFASLVAPFGGFLASAIKRAYGIKDFDSIIPGHGGVMDRMDCQFLMALCTWVHYNTFVKLATVSVPKLLYMYSLLSQPEQAQFVMELILNNTEVGTLSTSQVHRLQSFLKQKL